jgi:hypothetical protein
MRNRADSARNFCADMGFTFRACISGKQSALAMLSDLTRTPLQAIEQATIRDQGQSFTFRGEHISRAMLRRTKIYVCPLCLRTDLEAATHADAAPYGRIMWQFSVIRTCPHHACALFQICDDKRNDKYDFARLVQGHIATIIRDAEATPPRRPSRLELYVDDRLCGRSTGAPWLDRLDLHAACATTEILGLLLTFGPLAKPRSLPIDVLHEAGDLGYTIAHGGEPAIREALAEVQRRHERTRSGLDGPSGVFGYFYKSLSFREADGFAPVRDLVRRHIIETMPVGPGDVVCGEPVRHRILHTIRTAARETGRDVRRMRAVLAEAGLIRSDHARFPSNAVTFEAEPNRAFLDANAGGVSFNAVVARLGAGRAQADLLLQHGYIQPTVTCRTSNNSRSYNYSLAQIELFLSQLRDKMPAVQSVPRGLRTIPAAARRAQCSATKIIDLIREKKLKRVAYSIGNESYLGIYVDPNEIRYLLGDDRGGSVTPRVARSILGVSLPVIRALIREKLIISEVRLDPFRGIKTEIISRQSLDAFHINFVNGAELSNFDRSAYGKTWNVLKSVEPAFDVARIGAKFYRRDDIEILL